MPHDGPLDYQARVDWLAAWTEPPDASAGGAADIAFTLEALGVTPEGFEAVLRHALTVRERYTPAALTEVSDRFRIGACQVGEACRFSGVALGHYCGRTVLAWPKTESQMRPRRRAPRA